MGAIEKTLALIKPDAVRAGHVGEILRRIHSKNFAILHRKTFQLTKETAHAFYKEHEGKSFFERLMNYMTSGPTMALVLCRFNAIQCWRDLMGPSNAALQRDQYPDTIRGLFGTDGTYNAVHGSDSFASAEREIRFFFPEAIIEPPPYDTEFEAFVNRLRANIGHALDPVLARGLAVLAKTKPTADSHAAIKFLGQWLIKNNPNRAQKPGLKDPLEDVNSERTVQPSDFENSEETSDRWWNENLTEERAAMKVQAAYRGYKVRKNLPSCKTGINNHHEPSRSDE